MCLATHKILQRSSSSLDSSNQALPRWPEEVLDAITKEPKVLPQGHPLTRDATNKAHMAMMITPGAGEEAALKVETLARRREAQEVELRNRDLSRCQTSKLFGKTSTCSLINSSSSSSTADTKEIMRSSQVQSWHLLLMLPGELGARRTTAKAPRRTCPHLKNLLSGNLRRQPRLSQGKKARSKGPRLLPRLHPTLQ